MFGNKSKRTLLAIQDLLCQGNTELTGCIEASRALLELLRDEYPVVLYWHPTIEQTLTETNELLSGLRDLMDSRNGIEELPLISHLGSRQ
jgi:hypothetical protein